jgi:hypothetical protein
LPFKSHFKGFFAAKIRFFIWNVNVSLFLSRFLLELENLFRFVLVSLFFADIEQNGSYFAFGHSEERIKQNILFRYRNELKIWSKNELVLCTLTSLVITILTNSPLSSVRSSASRKHCLQNCTMGEKFNASPKASSSFAPNVPSVLLHDTYRVVS